MSVFTDDEAKKLLGSQHAEIVRHMLMKEQLNAQLENRKDDPICGPQDIDLNPHITIRSMCQLIAYNVEARAKKLGFDFECTRDEIYETWLVDLLYKTNGAVR